MSFLGQMSGNQTIANATNPMTPLNGLMNMTQSGFSGTAAPIISPTGQWQADAAYNNAQSGLTQQQQFVDALKAQNGIGNQSNVFNQQQALANQMQGVANGTGPNPALAQLNQTTGNNISTQAALMAGQRGSGANAGLLARQAAQQGGALQQQSVGQGATLQAQQQLGGMQALAAQQQALGNTAGAQVGQQSNALSGYNQMAQGEQQNILNSIAQTNNANVGMQSNINNVNEGIATGNQKAKGDILGGLMKGVGTAATMAAHGGMIGGPQSHMGKYLAEGDKINMTEGGHVPGEGKVAGDSYANDTVPAVLSPKEIVIPRHITMGENAPQRAAEFVAKILGQKHDPKSNFYSGGETEGGGGGADESDDEEEAPAAQVPQSHGASSDFSVEGQGSPAQQGTVAPTQQMSPDMISQLQGSFEKQKQAAQMLGAAQSQQGKAESDILGQNTKDLQGLQQKYDPQYADIDQERSALTQDIQNGHIDPNHYLHDMSTGQKIGTAVGLILGGIGGGITHTDNPAQQFMQNQIDRDIEGQKADLGKKENLLSMNMRRFGNLKDAEMMTRANMMDITSMKLKQAAAQSQDPIARANALNEAAKIDAQAAQTIGPLKIRQEAFKQLSSSNAAPEQKSRLMQQTGIISPSESSNIDSSIAKIRANESLRKDLIGGYNQLKNNFAADTFSPTDRENTINNLSSKLWKAGGNRWNEEGAKQLVSSILPGRITSNDTDKNSMARLNQTIDLMNAEHQSKLNKYNITVPRGQPIQEGKPKI